MDWQKLTIKTYDDSAPALAEYFKGIGSRVKDIEIGLQKSPARDKVVEIGCGDGRDAVEIVKRVTYYEGFDPSIEMLKIARKKVPKGSFVLADALSYQYPGKLDIVYAFASLLHSPKDEIKQIFERVWQALKPAGIFYISLKEKPSYKKEIKRDQFGQRLFYYYNPDIIKDLAGPKYVSVYEDQQVMGHTKWFTIALAKA